MSSPLPLRPAVDHTPRDRSVLELTAESTDAVFEALGSDTARSILCSLREDPATASDVAERVDTSLQNVQYHLDKLLDAGLVAAVGTWYSSRGTEMTVYAHTVERLDIAICEPADNARDGEAMAVAVTAAASDD